MRLFQVNYSLVLTIHNKMTGKVKKGSAGKEKIAQYNVKDDGKYECLVEGCSRPNYIFSCKRNWMDHWNRDPVHRKLNLHSDIMVQCRKIRQCMPVVVR